MTKNVLTNDLILLADIMYLQKSIQYSNGKFISADENRNVYKGEIVFIIWGLKQLVSVVLKECPEVALTGKWLGDQLADCAFALAQAGFNVQKIVIGNQACYMNVFAET